MRSKPRMTIAEVIGQGRGWFGLSFLVWFVKFVISIVMMPINLFCSTLDDTIGVPSEAQVALMLNEMGAHKQHQSAEQGDPREVREQPSIVDSLVNKRVE